MAGKLIVIGGTSAGLTAASAARHILPGLEIVLYERSGFISRETGALPYFLGGSIEDPEERMSVTMEEIVQKRDIHVRILHEILGIDRKRKRVLAKDLVTGRVFEDPYEKLILASGASPVHIHIPGSDSTDVHYMRTMEDVIGLRSALRRGARRAAVIGGGITGLQTAEELSRAGLDVTVLEALPRLCPVLPDAYSAEILRCMESNHVHVITGAEITQIRCENGRVRSVCLKDGRSIPVEIVVCCTGIRPNSGLAVECGLDLGLRGAVCVDRSMRTSDADIWACGDCAETYHALTGRQDYVPSGTTAQKQGRVAGQSAAGGEAAFEGTIGSMGARFFDLYAAMTGLMPEKAAGCGVDASEIMITQNERTGVHSGIPPMQLRISFERKTGRILGAQSIGGENSMGTINTLAACISAEMDVRALNSLDLVYAPAALPVRDPIQVAAELAIRKM